MASVSVVVVSESREAPEARMMRLRNFGLTAVLLIEALYLI